MAELIQADDLDGLLVRIDHLCADGHWDGLVDLRDRARRALERGRQLWPAASHAEYRLALEAPGPWAAAVLVPGAARFALGPVSEVAASTHTWAELAPHAPGTPEATLAAHERVIRGEDLTGDRSVDSGVLEIPLRLQDWEPTYPVAVYRAHEAHFDAPPEATGPSGADPTEPSPTGTLAEPMGGEPPVEFDGTQALSDLVSEWRDGSEGRVRVVAVENDAAGAAAALGAPTSRLTPITPSGAMSAMAWAAASGGAHGRRRGMAAGRFGAWWAVAALAGGLDEWPLSGDWMGAALDGLGWYRWDHGHASTGWALRLAVQNPDRALAWAIEAVDPAPPPAGHPDNAPEAGTARIGGHDARHRRPPARNSPGNRSSQYGQPDDLVGGPTLEEVRLEVPASPEYLRMSRIMAAGVASRLGFTLDEVEDLRIAIDELCFALVGREGRTGKVTLRYRMTPEGLAVEGSGHFQGTDASPEPTLSPLSLQILGAVVDNCELLTGADGPGFRFFKHRGAG